MRRIVMRADDILRGRPWAVQGKQAGRGLAHLVTLLIGFGAIYGAVMGSFGGWGGDRWRQVIFSAVKVSLLLLATYALSVPSYFVLNTLAGVRRDFGRALQALAATQTSLTIILASLTPLTAVWYVSCANYNAAILFNALMFGVASLAAQQTLRRYYRPLIAGAPRHRWLLRAWMVIYAFVGIQMAWVLRPFVGMPGLEVRFFRQGAWGNAYEQLVQIASRLFAG
jgi:hypothetical protein